MQMKQMQTFKIYFYNSAEIHHSFHWSSRTAGVETITRWSSCQCLNTSRKVQLSSEMWLYLGSIKDNFLWKHSGQPFIQLHASISLIWFNDRSLLFLCLLHWDVCETDLCTNPVRSVMLLIFNWGTFQCDLHVISSCVHQPRCIRQLSATVLQF